MDVSDATAPAQADPRRYGGVWQMNLNTNHKCPTLSPSSFCRHCAGPTCPFFSRTPTRTRRHRPEGAATGRREVYDVIGIEAEGWKGMAGERFGRREFQEERDSSLPPQPPIPSPLDSIEPRFVPTSVSCTALSLRLRST